MTFGLVGSHRVGKTTLATRLSQDTDLPLVLTSTSAVFKAHGITLRESISTDDRLRVQDEILDAAIEAWSKEEGAFITDRTPIDMMAYTLADVSATTNHTPEQIAAMRTYMKRCFDAGNRFFRLYVLIQPGIPIIEDATNKVTGALNPIYMEHLNAVMQGLMMNPANEVNSLSLCRDVLDLDRRAAVLRSLVQREWANEFRLRSQLGLH